MLCVWEDDMELLVYAYISIPTELVGKGFG